MHRKLFLIHSTQTLLTLAAAAMMTAAFTAHAQRPKPPQYKVADLGPSGNPFSQAAAVADTGLVAGVETAPDGTSRSILWYKGQPIDINASLGGPNNAAGGVNLRSDPWSGRNLAKRPQQ
jgi:hypothetical protein